MGQLIPGITAHQAGVVGVEVNAGVLERQLGERIADHGDDGFRLQAEGLAQHLTGDFDAQAGQLEGHFGVQAVQRLIQLSGGFQEAGGGLEADLQRFLLTACHAFGMTGLIAFLLPGGIGLALNLRHLLGRRQTQLGRRRLAHRRRYRRRAVIEGGKFPAFPRGL